MFHVLLIALLLEPATRKAATRIMEQPRESVPSTVPLYFAPPAPVPTPRAPPADLPPIAPLTEGPDADPGSTARTDPEPEPEPNASPEAAPETATRPDPGDATEKPGESEATATPPSAAPSSNPVVNETEMRAEAQRLFGRPSARLGPATGTQESRPWESARSSDSRGCTLPPEDSTDMSVPRGMAVIEGRIYHEGTGEPLGGARLQILGTPYGAFSDPRGNYRLVFARELVNRCRTQMVRVSAPGYRGRDVLLYMGEYGNGDVPLSRY
ncbi:MAG: hypothetical protein OEV95_01820 [Gemmatimonadota bacterium]|nr:hypothetical protein [Gemmatimonadota bacterium]